MTMVVLETDFKTPASPEVLHGVEKGTVWCMSVYGVELTLHYLSKDGLRLVCVFNAPDAESLRLSVRQAGIAPPRSMWSSTMHDPPGSKATDVPLLAEHGLNLSVVERNFDAPVDFSDIQSIEDEAASCLALHRVRFVRTYFSFDRRRMLCLYEAPDAESVRIANREARLPFERVWAAQIVLPGTEA